MICISCAFNSLLTSWSHLETRTGQDMSSSRPAFSVLELAGLSRNTGPFSRNPNLSGATKDRFAE